MFCVLLFDKNEQLFLGVIKSPDTEFLTSLWPAINPKSFPSGDLKLQRTAKNQLFGAMQVFPMFKRNLLWHHGVSLVVKAIWPAVDAQTENSLKSLRF